LQKTNAQLYFDMCRKFCSHNSPFCQNNLDYETIQYFRNFGSCRYHPKTMPRHSSVIFI
jgi:hypothetical protein